MIRIIIAEDHNLVRAGLRALVEKTGEISVVGEATNGQEAIELAEKLKPDILLMDIMMPRLNGIQTAEKIREYKIPTQVLLLSMYADAGLVHQALKSGARGYVLKTSVSEELFRAIKAVANGETFLSSRISSIVIESAFQHPNDSEDLMDIISPREKEVLQLIAEEQTSSEIAQLLFISEKTVEKHRTSLMEKLKVKNIAGLVKFAISHSMIDQRGVESE